MASTGPAKNEMLMDQFITLSRNEMVIDQFIQLHNSNKKLNKKIIDFLILQTNHPFCVACG